MMNAITNIIAWFVKNVSMIAGIVGALAKLVAGVFHFWSPPEDSWINKVDDVLLWVQKNLFKWAEVLKKFGRPI